MANPSDAQRGSAGDVARASAARVAEALRSIEEYAKPLDAEFAARVDPLRYRMYELQRRLSATLSAQQKFAEVGIYVIITADLCARDWFATAELAVEGGAGAIQLREKGLSDAELLLRARRLSELCHECGTLFIVNDRPDIALLSHADGVHVGQDDLSVADVRRMVPASMIVGFSTHTREQIDRAITDAPDYIAVGPMFPTATKPQQHIAGAETLSYARQRTSLPLVAIGGITATNAPQVLAAASCTLCVCATVISRNDPRTATHQLRAITDYSNAAPPSDR
jgi:thiamine-phosphate pyrophosphorylase